MIEKKHHVLAAKSSQFISLTSRAPHRKETYLPYFYLTVDNSRLKSHLSLPLSPIWI